MEILTNRFITWKNQYPESQDMSVYDYISHNFHPDDVLIISLLFFPKLIEVNGAIFLEHRYTPETYSKWVGEFGNDRQSIEKMINHIHIYDIFGYCTDNVDDSVFEMVGRLLHLSWMSHFKYEYSHFNLVVEYSYVESDYGPTLYVYQK